MLDALAVEVCAQCVAGAAAYDGDQEDLMLTAVALARDLSDTHGDRAGDMLDRASREATALLDGSDLGADAFAKALHRLADIRAGVQTRLAGCAESGIGS